MIGLVSAVLPAVTDIVGRFLPEDKEERAKAERAIKASLTEHLAKVDLAQIDVNKEEAKGNWFQSSWRPAVAWICVLGMAVNFLISPLLAPLGVVVPPSDTSVMMPVLMGMLGLGGLRRFEKVKQVTK